MAIDPNIALGFRPIQLEQRNPLAEYAQIQNIQTGQLQNQLARQQMEQEQGVINYLGSANLNTPEGISGLNKFGKTGLGYAKLIAEQEANALKNKEMQGKLREQQMAALGTGLTSVMHDPTDEKLAQAFDRLEATGVDVSKLRDQFSKLPDLASRKAGINSYVMSHPEGRAALAFVQPKPENFDLNGKIVTLDMNPNSSTYKQLIQEQTKTQTFADKNAAARLVFEQNKFAWEKANPGYEIREDADGNTVGVNKRTLQAFPVMIGGGGAPTAAPRVPGAGMPGPRVAPASAVVQAIPGMTSVLDQAAPAAPIAPVAGGPRQLVGKGKEAPAKFHDIDMQLSGLAGSLKAFKDEIKNEPITGAPLLPKGADTARMQAKYTSLLMGLKDLYTLGALTGPDMSIIESQINNPASWSGKLASYKGIKEQTKVIEDMLQRSTQNLENTYGRKPNATLKAMEPLKNVPGGSDSDPLGLLGVKR